MTTQEILDKITTSREQLLIAIENITPEQMMTPGVNGDWTLKDILAHLAAWQSRLVRLLFQLERRQKPQWDVRDLDGMNAETYANQKDRSLDAVLADFYEVYDQVITRVENLDARALAQRIGNAILTDIIAANTYEHDEEHIPQIESWKEKNALQK